MNCKNYTNGFLKPFIKTNSNTDLSYVYEAPIKTLLSLSHLVGKDPSYKNSLRIYVNGEAREDLEEQVLKSVPNSFSDLEQWGKDTFDNQDYLIILNRVEKWYDPIVKWCGELFQDSKGIIDERLLHLEVTYFIGNTTYTPFGVHIDEISDALHLNLGPNKRYMHLWEPDIYRKVRGSLLPLHNPGGHVLEYAKHYQINPNHWFFLPASKYFHIGENTDFSVSLALALIKYDEDTIIKRSLKESSLSYNENTPIDVASLLKCIINEEANSEDGVIPYSKLSKLNNEVEEKVIEYIFRIRSNLGFKVPTTQGSLEFININKWKNSSFSLVNPFKLIVLEKSEKIHLFARGNMISISKNETVLELIRTINLGKEVETNTLIRLFGDRLSESTLYYLIERLYKCEVIEVSTFELQ
ncbi:hypothetical protein ACIQYG_22075 [Peribacillus sp. NPDC096622]|uniref:hypothetical protein n=1 Tax=Peribacillus sp. NPDC096622 TaxID=3364396 RepID=UPI0037F64BA3